MITQNSLKLLILLLFCSCASLYSGRNLKNVPIEDLKSSEYSVTLRFINISEYGSQEYFITKSEHHSKEVFNYVRSLNIFRKVELIQFPYESVSLRSKEKLDELLTTTVSSTDTDYFIDIRRYSVHSSRAEGWEPGGALSVP
jgi:hypothetical protein